MPLDGSDFVSSKSLVSVKSRICSRNRSDASILKLWKNVYDKDNERGTRESAPEIEGGKSKWKTSAWWAPPWPFWWLVLWQPAAVPLPPAALPTAPLLPPHLYRSAFTNFHMGYSCALAWILVVIIGLATAILFKTQNAWVHYEAE